MAEFKKHRADADASREKRKQMYARGGEVKDGRKESETHGIAGDAKAKPHDGDKVEGRARGGRTDRPGKTTINIVMPQGGGDQPPVAPVRPPMPVLPPGAPPPGMMPPPGAGGPPPGLPPHPPMPPQGGMAPMGPPGMPVRARGGRMTAGAGSGEGRIQKSEGKK